MRINSIHPTHHNYFYKKKQTSHNNLLTTLQSDDFIINDTTFRGRYGFPDKKDVKTAKKYLNGTISKETIIKRDYKDRYNEFIEDLGEDELDFKNPVVRTIFFIGSFGFDELLIQSGKLACKRDAKIYADEIEIIKEDLQNAKLREDAAASQKEKQLAQNRVNYLSAIEQVKEDELFPKLLNKIQARKEGRNVEIPNCIMIVNSDESINSELINWCGNNINGQFITIEDIESVDLVDILEEAEDDYQNNGNWNLIYVKGMDKLINPLTSEKAVIASMKAIMSSIAEEFHSTLIFSTTNPDKLDDTAIESNRVCKINSENIKSVKTLQKEDAEKRLKDKKYVSNTPLAAINDLLIWLDLPENVYALNFDSTEEKINETSKRIRKELNSRILPDYIAILKDALSKAWYI